MKKPHYWRLRRKGYAMFDSIITTSQAKSAVDENNGTFVLLRLKDGFENILNGSKTMEILKSSCWNLKAPFFVLCCNDEDDRIIGSFICNKIDDLYCPVELPNISSLEQLPYHTKQWLVQSGLTYYQLCAMAKRRQRLYGWMVNSPVALDLPLTAIGEEYPPQAWKYLSLTGIQAQLALAGAYAP